MDIYDYMFYYIVFHLFVYAPIAIIFLEEYVSTKNLPLWHFTCIIIFMPYGIVLGITGFFNKLEKITKR